MWIGFGGFLASFLIFPLGYSVLPGMDGPVTLFGIATMLTCIIVGAVKTKTIRPAKIDKDYAHLVTGKMFLRGMPSQQ